MKRLPRIERFSFRRRCSLLHPIKTLALFYILHFNRAETSCMPVGQAENVEEPKELL
jgi:hypothetical protein